MVRAFALHTRFQIWPDTANQKYDGFFIRVRTLLSPCRQFLEGLGYLLI
jgi:hypothetical protein